MPDASYDVLLACHVLEHLPRPLVALANWLRVLRHGGLLVLVLPDPCARRRPATSTGKTTCSVGERTLMDRYRLAHPGSHHVRDFWNRAPELVKPPPEHAMEMALSTYRLLELLHILKEPSLAGTGALEEVRGRLALPAATTWDELRSMRLHLIGHKDREGHVHVWSRRTLKDMLRAAERLLAAVALVAETAASQPAGARRFQEYRAVLAKGAGDAVDVFRDLFAKRWCLRANASYVRAARHASPILLGDIDVDEPDPAFRGSTPVVCTHLVRAVRTWEACAPAATKADRRDCLRRAAEHTAYLAARTDQLQGVG